MKHTRTIFPLILTAGLLLTACSGGAGGSGGTDAAGEDCVTAGDASSSIEVAGDPGAELTMSGETPLSLEGGIERSVLSEGEGDTVEVGQGLVMTTSIFNGNTGELIEAASPQGIVYQEGQQLSPWADAVIGCAAEGQRSVVVGTSTDTFGAPAEQVGLPGVTGDDAVVFVNDVISVRDLPTKAEGETVDAPEGFPGVELDEDGAPTITVPEGAEAPEQLETATLIEGDGETVEPGDVVFVNYRGIIWRTGEEFDSSWTNGAPTAFSTTGVIGGFQQALEGQTVGSQVISVVPADDGGYGATQLEGMGHEPDDVMVFVLDILDAVHAPAAE